MADGVSDPGPKPSDDAGRHRPQADPHRRHPVRRSLPPDDRRTAILPPVRDVAPPQWRDPIDVVKAALDGTPPPKQPPPPPAPPRRPPGGGGPPGGPPGEQPGQRPQINWKWVRRGPRRGGRRDDRAADHHLRDGLHDRRRAQAGRYPDQPGVDDPGQRRQRAGENRSAGRQPRRRQHRPDSGAGAQRGNGRRGPRLLLQPRVLVHRLHPGHEEQPVRRRPAGWLHDHPAVREERVGRRRTLGCRRPDPQGQGSWSSRRRCPANGPKTRCCSRI